MPAAVFWKLTSPFSAITAATGPMLANINRQLAEAALTDTTAMPASCSYSRANIVALSRRPLLVSVLSTSVGKDSTPLNKRASACDHGCIDAPSRVVVAVTCSSRLGPVY